MIKMIFRLFLCTAIARVFVSIVQAEEPPTKTLQNEQVQSFDNSNVCLSPGPFSLGPEIETLRMVTKEELAFHDGKQTDSFWLSIMSRVYDVSAGPEYYSPDGPYRVFVGRDANVPFITGVFNPDEAEKKLTELENHQLFALEHWSQFYDDEDKYPFIGLLVGELYDSDGSPTEELKKVRVMIAKARIEAEERKKRTAELIAKRKAEAAAKKNLKA